MIWLALALSIVSAFAISEYAFRQGLTRAGRVVVPVGLGLFAWLGWVALGLPR